MGEKHTPGPWTIDPVLWPGVIHGPNDELVGHFFPRSTPSKADLALILKAPTLAAEVSRLEGEVAALRGLLHMWLWWCDASGAPEHVRQRLFDKAHDASRAKLAEGGRDGE